MIEAKAWRRRSLGVLLALVASASLVALPLVGLVRIGHITDRSHHLTEIVVDSNALSNNLLQLVIGPLARYGASHDATAREESVAGLAEARAILARVDARASLAQDLGIDQALNAHLANVRTVLDGSDKYIAEIDSGLGVAEAPSTPLVANGATQMLNSQVAFSGAVGPVGRQIDQDRQDAVREAEYLLGAAAVIAVLALGSLVLIDGRVVQRRFAREATRRETAERLAAHRADVVNMASHELRNPLTVLTLSTGFLRRSAMARDDEEISDLATDAHTAALRCQTLVDELLDLSRLDADRLQLKMGRTPVLAALSEAVAMSESHHGPHRVVVSGDETATVSADPDRLRIIIRNLIDNAFKYSPDETTVHIRIEQWDDRIRVEVADEGVGIPESARELIFQRFQRLQPTQHLSGVGIGLYLSRELARRMNGELQCGDSDRGASFRLELPLAA